MDLNVLQNVVLLGLVAGLVARGRGLPLWRASLGAGAGVVFGGGVAAVVLVVLFSDNLLFGTMGLGPRWRELGKLASAARPCAELRARWTAKLARVILKALHARRRWPLSR